MLIDQLSAAGVSVLVTTHYLDEAEHCHRIAIIHGGRLAALGSTRELIETFAHRVILEIQASKPVEAMRLLDQMPDVEKTSVFGTAVHAVLKAGHNEAAGLVKGRLTAAGLSVAAVAPVQPSLEDVFLEVAGTAA
jgi:ABC-2 type transport system ATP-binding protein